MANWLSRTMDSAINFVNKVAEAISENPAFKTTKFFTRLLFGIPLGAVRLLAVDLPIQLCVTAARIAHTTSFTTLWKNISNKKVDPFYEDLSEKARAMTRNFVKGFMFGPYLDMANKAKDLMEDYQSKNFGTAKKTSGALNAKDNQATTSPEKAKEFIDQKIRLASTAMVDGKNPSPFFVPKSAQGLASGGFDNIMSGGSRSGATKQKPSFSKTMINSIIPSRTH